MSTRDGARTLRPVVFIAYALSFGQHALMKDAANQNASDRQAVKHHVPTVLHAPKAWADIVTDAA